ncbi:hypothetical protein B0H16DRAFT_1718048 [Mycena metata]|uniref:Actin-like ATPase domain-containing protein n=1 Tax=Mycena metata TaxID=1033252 RepID=A0AAD7JHE7_9AGAR|nr:hypothetical protein B0H16DRAFT_1718048 [Mycena metata]
MSADNRRAPYAGPSKKLIISIDVGTTFTATSFCLLQPGNVPKFEEILRWPKQATPDAKVPSVLYYDNDGKARAFGAETEDEVGFFVPAPSKEWKLLLRPAHLPIIKDLVLPPLPPNIQVDQIFTDHLSYIKDQVKAYITSTYGSGGDIWDILSPTMYVILTTPNGWEGSQQNRMRQAAIKAGLVDEEGGRRVKFVTEAEAAVLYAADSGSVNDWLVEDGHLILCDCGGGTVDITGYKINAVKPALKLEESSASRCYLAGAVFVTQAAKAFFKERLSGTEWDDEDILQKIVYNFDRNAKKKFAEGDTVCYVQLDGHKTVPNLGITRGRLKITGEEMESFFKAPLEQIKEGLEIAFENGGRLADSHQKVILVGGLASSPYMYSKLVAWGKEYGISVSRPDGPTVKAVANGALAWHLDASVGSRVTKCHYGISVVTTFDPANPEHREREREKKLGVNGVLELAGEWSGIVAKNQKIKVADELSQSFIANKLANTTNFEHSCRIYAYRRLTPPTFIRFPGKQTLVPGFDLICTVSADLQKCFRATPTKIGWSGKYKEFDVCLALGETEITARLRWLENNIPVYGPATVAYD